jgi:hypothetical protein
MAQRTVVHLVDDLDNKELNGDGKTVSFGFEKNLYEIDLSKQNAQRLRDALAPYIAAGRRVDNRSSGDAATAKADYEQLQAMRRWARDQGMKVSDRGRVSKEVQTAYRAAH